MPDWPTTVPRLCRLSDMKMQPVSNSIQIDPEVGEPMTRRRFTGDMDDIQGSFYLITRTEALAIKDFWRTTLKDGSLTFTTEHPITQVDGVEFIFMSQPQLSRVSHLYNVSISIRSMPV